MEKLHSGLQPVLLSIAPEQRAMSCTLLHVKIWLNMLEKWPHPAGKGNQSGCVLYNIHFFTNQRVMWCVLPDICPHTHSYMCCNKSGFSLASRSVTVNMLKQLPSLSVFTQQTTSEHCSVGYIYTPLFTGPTLHTPTSSGSPSPHPQPVPASHFSLSLINSCCQSSATFYTAMIPTQ